MTILGEGGREEIEEERQGSASGNVEIVGIREQDAIMGKYSRNIITGADKSENKLVSAPAAA